MGWHYRMCYGILTAGKTAYFLEVVMHTTNDGPAFPTTAPVINYGMTLRDWFAGQALTGILLSKCELDVTTDSYKKAIASISYDLADAMIVERNKA